MAGLTNKVTLGDTSPFTPALASFRGILFIAWRGDGNDNLNIMFSSDGGQNFGGKSVFNEMSTEPPALAASGDRLFIAWKGDGNDNLNIAEVVLLANSTDGLIGTELINKVTVGDTSPRAPGLTSHDGRLFITWKGDGNDNLNVAQVVI